jgi:hypothetical protein
MLPSREICIDKFDQGLTPSMRQVLCVCVCVRARVRVRASACLYAYVFVHMYTGYV